MKEKENPIAQRYRAMILDAFMKLTRSVPYHEITILRIVQEADVSRQTFYRHFHSKDDILTALMEEISQGVTMRLRELAVPSRREIFADRLRGAHRVVADRRVRQHHAGAARGSAPALCCRVRAGVCAHQVVPDRRTLSDEGRLVRARVP